MPGAYLYGYDESTGLPVKCKVTADGKLIINPAGFLENPPTEDQALKAPTSEWAFDHKENANAHHTPTVAGDLDHQDLGNIGTDDHHTKFTAADARASINNVFGADGKADTMIDFDRQDFQRCEHIYMSGRQAGQGVGCLYYGGGSKHWRFWGKDVAGVYADPKMEYYSGSAWLELAKQAWVNSQMAAALEKPPTEDEANKAPTSEWAYDHWKDPAAHHAVYTDAMAAMASYASYIVLTNGTYNNQDVAGVHQIRLSTSGGDIILNGLANGAEGQIIFLVNTSGSNEIIINSLSGSASPNDRIVTYSGLTETIPAHSYGSFYLIYNTLKWWVNMPLV